MDKELALLQQLWKKAATMEKPIEIPHKSASDAKRRRFQLYNAVKKVKMKPELDPELAEAAAQCTVSFKRDDPTTILLGQKLPGDDLVQLAQGLGIDVDALKPVQSEADIAANASLKTLESMLEGTAGTPQHRPNKFYDRTGG